jgi:hypothetical protein
MTNPEQKYWGNDDYEMAEEAAEYARRKRFWEAVWEGVRSTLIISVVMIVASTILFCSLGGVAWVMKPTKPSISRPA